MRQHLAVTLAAAAVLAVCGAARGADIARGAELYQRHCSGCHGASGTSIWPGTPNLARREGLLKPDAVLLQSLQTGRGTKPGFRGLLTDAEILDTIAYSRTLAR